MKEAEERKKRKQVLEYNVTVGAIVNYIKLGHAKKIVCVIGTGLYSHVGFKPNMDLYIKKYNLKNSEDIFDIALFNQDPSAYYAYTHHLLSMYNQKPTAVHRFVKLLEVNGLLLRCYTQNIDALEQEAGISSDLLVQAYGSLATSHCTSCGAIYSFQYFKDKLASSASDSCGKSVECRDEGGDVHSSRPWCLCAIPTCQGNVRPDCVFYGERYQNTVLTRVETQS